MGYRSLGQYRRPAVRMGETETGAKALPGVVLDLRRRHVLVVVALVLNWFCVFGAYWSVLGSSSDVVGGGMALWYGTGVVVFSVLGFFAVDYRLTETRQGARALVSGLPMAALALLAYEVYA